MRVLSTVAAATLLSLALAAPARGHAELVPWQLPPGAEARLLLLVTHGCGDEDERISTEPLEEEPTVAVAVRAPLELEIVPGELDGWTLTEETDANGRVTAARWDSDDPDGTTETLQIPMDVRVGDVPNGSEIWLPVVQECAGGASLSWTLEGDVRGGDEIPAMRLLVDEDASAPPTGRGVDGSTWPGRLAVPSIVLALLGTAGLTDAVRRRRRSSHPAR